MSTDCANIDLVIMLTATSYLASSHLTLVTKAADNQGLIGAARMKTHHGRTRYTDGINCLRQKNVMKKKQGNTKYMHTKKSF